MLKKHYATIAQRFSYAKFISLILIVFFILFAFNFYRDDITVENFRYMIKYLDFEAPDSSVSISNTSISFDGDTMEQIVLYRNDIAVVKKSGVELYDLAGQKIFTSEFTMTSPTAVCGDKYMMIFDLGGNHVAVFNTFSKIWEETFDRPITDATINDKGQFCIVTSEKGYTSAVYMYNPDFERVYRWLSGDKYIIDVSMSSNQADKFIISALRAKNGFFESELILLSNKSDQKLASLSLSDQMAIEVSDFSDSATLLTDKSLVFFDPQNLEIKNSVSFPRDMLQDFVFNDNYSVLVQTKKVIGSKNSMTVYYADGKPLTTFFSEGQIIDVCLSDDYLYQLVSGELSIYNLKSLSKEVLTVDKSFDRLICDDSIVILANNNQAVTVKGE